MSDGTDPTQVAIACQGGGSHTAFTAGVLQGLLAEWEPSTRLVGISGTSGGAFNALATWYGLVTSDEDRAIELLDAIWNDLAVSGVRDWLANGWLLGTHRLEAMGMPLPRLRPYQTPASGIGQDRIREALESNLDFDAIPELCERRTPELVVGTVNINAGVFETFTNEEVTTEAVLASAAIPELFEAVEIDGHYHWDGLFSQNPPIDDLMTVDAVRKPDELWVVQINPQERRGEPSSTEEIANRRNELAGNISLNQELRFVERVNDWVDRGRLPAERFARTRIERISMDEKYSAASKVDRSSEFIDDLMERGRRKATEFRQNRGTDR